MSALVSVLVPCFNAERYIGETLRSIFAQTWPNLEVIVVDDGSTDASVVEIGKFEGRVKLVSQENSGQSAALNRALAAASGDYIQYLDADDLLSAQKIERQMARLQEHRYAVASGEWARFWSHLDEARFAPEPVWQDLAPVDWVVGSRQTGLGMMFPALWLIPRAVVDKAGPWREDLTLNNDAEYFTRVLLASERVLFCEGARCYYRSGIPGSVSGRKTPEAWRSQFTTLDLCERYVREREDSERTRRAFAISWQLIAHGCYPYAADVAEAALVRASALDSKRIPPKGGWRFRALSRAIGWRAARILQVAMGAA
jgi:glycosyltransferase involved in cell wall biosynthesis